LNAEDEIWVPVIDVIEMQDQFLLKVELPGVKDEDISLSISGDTLTIEGEKKTEPEVKKKDYYYSESSYGSFARSITIPSTVDINKIEAGCDTGVIEITLPKTADIKPEKIAITPKKKAVASKTKKEITARK
jgi:HSP20 family protein